MPWTNYHSHSRYCDGTDEPERYVERALTDKLLAYGFSSHAPVPFDCGWCMKTDKLQSYALEINRLKHHWQEDIQLYCGLEIDFIPGVISPKSEVFQPLQLDYTIGSVHFVDKFPDGKHWEIDGLHQVFLQGLDQIFRGNIQIAVCRYYELIRQMVHSSCPDVVGHLDKIKIQSETGSLFSESADWYREAVEETLHTIAQAGVIVEVNTRGLYKKKSVETYPSRWVLKQMHAMNIPITLNSDAHHPDEITTYFSATALVLKEVGYQQVSVLLNGKWQSVAFNEHGLVL
ncbi:MAG: histidinol-phosphatase [Bacteroidota bacterium]